MHCNLRLSDVASAVVLGLDLQAIKTGHNINLYSPTSGSKERNIQTY